MALMKGYVFFLLFLCSISVALAATKVETADHVVVNSADWQDVYSAVEYANLQNMPSNFLSSSAHGPVLPFAIPKDRSVVVFSSQRNPYIVGYRTVLENFGFDVQELSLSSMNLDLARRLTSVNKYIVVDGAYGYNAISVASYAAIDDYYVLFANERNARSVESFLASKNSQSVIIYGQVDARVKTALARFNPEYINTGDRFQNNIEIVKRYLQKKPTRQVVLSNGEFIENGIVSGADPVLFVGRGNVPDQIKTFIKDSNIDVAILIGNELIGSATTVRREIGVSVFVKFAQGARTPSGPVTTVEDLDRFPMPSYVLDLQLYTILYNKATNTLEVTFKNNVDIGTFLKSTIRINAGDQTFIVGDADVQFIDKNQYKTFLYTTTTDGKPLLLESDTANGSIDTIFGESRGSLEFRLQGNFQVSYISVLDDTKLTIENVAYDRLRHMFLVTVKNIGEIDTYVFAEMQDVIVNGEPSLLASTEELLAPGKNKVLEIPAVLSDQDVADNQLVRTKAYYGARQNSLIKTTYAEFAFAFARLDIILYILIILVLLLLALFIFGRKKCPDCKHKNPPFARKCKKCGALLRGHRRHHGHKEHEKKA
ncbi:MAG: zinc ribbon domain-containing protein [archaeon]